MASHENCPVHILGKVTGDGKVVVTDSAEPDSSDKSTPVHLPLELVLGKMPKKMFVDDHGENKLVELVFSIGYDGAGCGGSGFAFAFGLV